jgi:restriction endonuclease S subunit
MPRKSKAVDKTYLNLRIPEIKLLKGIVDIFEVQEGCPHRCIICSQDAPKYKSNNDFFINLFNSNIFQSRILEKAQGSAIPNMVGVDILKKIVIGLSPLSEQERIVKKINQLMKLCDELEQKVMENQKNSELLMDAVLREAFETK